MRQPENADRRGSAVARASREEPGCTSYRLYEDSERPNEFVFIGSRDLTDVRRR